MDEFYDAGATEALGRLSDAGLHVHVHERPWAGYHGGFMVYLWDETADILLASLEPPRPLRDVAVEALGQYLALKFPRGV